MVERFDRIGPLLLTNASCRYYNFQCILLICWEYFDILVLLGLRKLYWIRLTGDQQTVVMTIFLCKFSFGQRFRASQSNHWAEHWQSSYKTYFTSHITIRWRNGSQLLYRIREDDTSKWLFWFSVSSWGTHLLNFFTFSICFKCWLTIEWPMLSSSATSHVVVRGSALMSLSVGHCRLPMASQYAPHLQGSRALWKLVEATLHWTFISSFWAKCVVDVVSCLCFFTSHFVLK